MHDWHFTRHARDRMREHGILETEVVGALYAPVGGPTPGGRDGQFIYWGRKVGAVTYPDERVVVTVYPDRGNFNRAKDPEEATVAVARVAAAAKRASSGWSRADARRLLVDGYSKAHVARLTGFQF